MKTLRYDFLWGGATGVDKYDDRTETLERKRKKSVSWYQKVIASNGENL